MSKNALDKRVKSKDNFAHNQAKNNRIEINQEAPKDVMKPQKQTQCKRYEKYKMFCVFFL